VNYFYTFQTKAGEPERHVEWRERSAMPVVAIYDIHGNLPALEAVLRDIRQAEADRIVVGGDVLPGPMPRETLARLLDLDLPVEELK
jgi:Icc-related predicted phosphoesterase